MKYVIMYTSRPDLEAEISPDDHAKVYQDIFAWFEEHGAAGRFSDSGAELQPPPTATTVRTGDGPGAEPVVVDGPFSEAKESIGGFSIIDVPDLDAAIAMVRTWPQLGMPGIAVEIRPIVDHSSS